MENIHEGKGFQEFLNAQNVHVGRFLEKIKKDQAWLDKVVAGKTVGMDDKALVSYYFESPFSAIISGGMVVGPIKTNAATKQELHDQKKTEAKQRRDFHREFDDDLLGRR